MAIPIVQTQWIDAIGSPLEVISVTFVVSVAVIAVI